MNMFNLTFADLDALKEVAVNFREVGFEHSRDLKCHIVFHGMILGPDMNLSFEKLKKTYEYDLPGARSIWVDSDDTTILYAPGQT
jgi:hypothetical protein